MKGKHIAIPFLCLIPLCSIITSININDDVGFVYFILWIVSSVITVIFIISVIVFLIKEGWDERLDNLTLGDYTDFMGW